MTTRPTCDRCGSPLHPFQDRKHGDVRLRCVDVPNCGQWHDDVKTLNPRPVWHDDASPVEIPWP